MASLGYLLNDGSFAISPYAAKPYLGCTWCKLSTDRVSGFCDGCESYRKKQAEKFERIAVRMEVQAVLADEAGKTGPLGAKYFCARRDYAAKVAERFGGDATAAIDAWAGYSAREIAERIGALQ